MSRYRLTPEARTDLREIRDWIAADNPARAPSIIAEFHELFALVARTPLIGLDRSSLLQGVRSFRRGSYLAFYRVETDFVVVLRVVHGRRDLKRLFDA